MLALAASWMPTEAHALDQLLVFGRILQEGKKSEGATVIIYNGNAVYRTVTTTKSGKYAIKLPFGFYFTMEVKKEGYITKRVVFDTRIDAQIDLLDDYVCDVDLLDLNGSAAWTLAPTFPWPSSYTKATAPSITPKTTPFSCARNTRPPLPKL